MNFDFGIYGSDQVECEKIIEAPDQSSLTLEYVIALCYDPNRHSYIAAPIQYIFYFLYLKFLRRNNPCPCSLIRCYLNNRRGLIYGRKIISPKCHLR